MLCICLYMIGFGVLKSPPYCKTSTGVFESVTNILFCNLVRFISYTQLFMWILYLLIPHHRRPVFITFSLLIKLKSKTSLVLQFAQDNGLIIDLELLSNQVQTGLSHLFIFFSSFRLLATVAFITFYVYNLVGSYHFKLVFFLVFKDNKSNQISLTKLKLTNLFLQNNTKQFNLLWNPNQIILITFGG